MVPSYQKTPFRVAGLQWLPKARKENSRDRFPKEKKKLGDRDMQRKGEEKGKVKSGTGMWKEGVRRKEESRWKMAEGQHADCPGPDWHILGRLTDGEKEWGGRGWGAGES